MCFWQHFAFINQFGHGKYVVQLIFFSSVCRVGCATSRSPEKIPRKMVCAVDIFRHITVRAGKFLKTTVIIFQRKPLGLERLVITENGPNCINSIQLLFYNLYAPQYVLCSRNLIFYFFLQSLFSSKFYEFFFQFGISKLIQLCLQIL
jgi:hypothetical protein